MAYLVKYLDQFTSDYTVFLEQPHAAGQTIFIQARMAEYPEKLGALIQGLDRAVDPRRSSRSSEQCDSSMLEPKYSASHAVECGQGH